MATFVTQLPSALSWKYSTRIGYTIPRVLCLHEWLCGQALRIVVRHGCTGLRLYRDDSLES